MDPATNLVLAVLAGLGLLGSLSLDWYAAPVVDQTSTDGPVERFAFQVAHVFDTSATGLVSGHEALGGGRDVLIALVAVVALLAVAVSLASLRQGAENLMRVAALAGPVVVAVVAIAHPGDSASLRIHSCLLLGLAATVLMSSSSWHGANMRQKRAAPARPRYGAR